MYFIKYKFILIIYFQIISIFIFATFQQPQTSISYIFRIYLIQVF